MTSVTKKVLGSLNALAQEAKLETIDKVHLVLSEHPEVVNKELLEKLILQIKDSLAADPDPFAAIKTKAKPKVPRPPTAYNLFIKEKMGELKKENPDMPNTNLLSLAASKWNERKNETTSTDAPKKTKKVVKKTEKA